VNVLTRHYEVPEITERRAPKPVQELHQRLGTSYYLEMNFGGITDAQRVLRGIDVFRRELKIEESKHGFAFVYNRDDMNVLSLEEGVVVRLLVQRKEHRRNG